LSKSALRRIDRKENARLSSVLDDLLHHNITSPSKRVLFSVARLFPQVAIPKFVTINIGFIMPTLGAAALPYVKRDLYNSSVSVKRKIMGVPTITWLGG